MYLLKISCLLFTSLLSNAFSDTATTFTKYSEDVFSSSKGSQMITAEINNEHVVEQIKELQPNIVYYLNIEFIPNWVQFIVVQTHVYLHNATLKYNIEEVAQQYVTGQNIGLVQTVSTVRSAQLFLENESPFNVTALIAVVAYNKSVPVPGGCNMEFAVETAPWLQLNVSGGLVAVSSQPARVLGGECNLPYMRYDGYHLYLPDQDFSKDTYFDFISKMLTAERVQQNARKVPSALRSEMRHVFSAYHGTGSVFAVLVSSRPGQYAAYVPALTYTCSPFRYTDTCQVLTSAFSRSLCASVLFIGLFVCLFGHSFFQTELLLFSTLAGGIIAYVLMVPYGLSDSATILLSTVAGVTVGNGWLLLWWITGSPLLSLLVSTLNFGVLVASIVFYSILGDNPYMRSDINYWLGFGCVVLVVALLIAPFPNRVNILACSLVGSYAAIVPLDTYLGGNLKYILINTLRRATVPGFNEAIIDPPFQTKDGLLAAMWASLALVGYIVQSQRFGNRPPFPARPSLRCGSSSSTPLLSGQRPLLYGQPVTIMSASSIDSVFT